MNQLVAHAAATFGSAVKVVPGGGVEVRDAAALMSPAMDQLVWQAVFGSSAEKDAARWLLWELGQATGVRPYMEIGRVSCRERV